MAQFTYVGLVNLVILVKRHCRCRDLAVPGVPGPTAIERVEQIARNTPGMLLLHISVLAFVRADRLMLLSYRTPPFGIGCCGWFEVLVEYDLELTVVFRIYSSHQD